MQSHQNSKRSQGNFLYTKKHSALARDVVVLGGLWRSFDSADGSIKRRSFCGIPLFKERRKDGYRERAVLGLRWRTPLRGDPAWVRDLFFARFRDSYKPGSNREEYFSRFLLLQCDCLPVVRNWGINLGDYVQATAVKGMMERVAPSVPQSMTERDYLSFYDGEKAFTVMQGWFALGLHFFPNDRIWPIFVGFHLTPAIRDTFLAFLRFNPRYFDGHSIGCRDRSTLAFCRKLGLNAYLSRCFTMTLPRRQQTPQQGKVFLVDVPKSLRKLIPAHLLENAVHVSQRGIRDRGADEVSYFNSGEHYMNMCAEQLAQYRDEAALIITTAVHCASPCTAMGIPVLLFNVNGEEATTRFDFLCDILPIYTLEDIKAGKVNWEPQAPDIEALKADMELNLRLTIEQERSGVENPELAEVRKRLLHRED